MIEINLSSLQKTEKRIWVKQTSSRKGHYRRVKGAKPEEDREAVETKTTKIITDYEQTIKDQTFESCAVFGSDGNLVFTKDGEKDLIKFDKDEVDKLKGTRFTHNHPIGHSFSPADVRIACVTGIKEVRVITSKNKSFSLKMKDDTNLYPELWGSKIRQSYEKYNTAVREYFTVEIVDHRMTAEEANGKHFHEVWTRVANDINEIIYKGE